MKKIFLPFICFLSINAYSQNGIYIVTEKFDASNQQTYDSVFVTNTQGITTVQAIPNINMDLKNHNSSLNQIFNNITQLGYKMVANGPMQIGSLAYYTTWYFQQP